MIEDLKRVAWAWIAFIILTLGAAGWALGIYVAVRVALYYAGAVEVP